MPQPSAPVHLGDFLLEQHRFPAVYLLYYRGEVVYVGQSKTLKARIEQHLTEGVKKFDEVAFIRCCVSQLLPIEARYIRDLAPKYNACQLSKKLRERQSWTRANNRLSARRKRFVATLDDVKNGIKFVDASQCEIDKRDVGEFLQICESDANKAINSGAIKDYSILGLIKFVAANSGEMRRNLERFEDL